MVKMSLAEVRLVLKNKVDELAETFRYRKDSLFNTYKRIDKEETLMHEEHEFTVKDLSVKIDRLEAEIRKLRLILAKYNVSVFVDYKVKQSDTEKITLQEAIYLVKQYRENLPHIKWMGEQKTTSALVDPLRSYGSSSNIDKSYEEVTKPTYNTAEFREKGKKIEKLITKLEVAINQANYNTMIEIEGILLDD